MPTTPPKRLPTDSYAWIREPQVPSATDPPQPDPLENSSTSATRHTSGTERILHRLFLLLVILAVLGVLVWLGVEQHSEVVSRHPIGHFQRMSGPGGWPGRVVIETETGSYPLWGTPVIAKGTPLVLETRGSGDRYICDEPGSLCIETTGKEFKPSAQTRSLPTSSQSSHSSQGATP